MRTVVGLFDRIEDAQNAVQELLGEGFQRDELNFISRDSSGNYSREIQANRPIDPEETGDSASAGAGIGAVLGGLTGVLIGLGALAIPGIGPVIAAGPIAAGLAGAGIGAVSGGVIGALVDMGIPEEHANIYAEGVRRGATLVTVRVDDAQVDRALAVLNRHHPVDIEQHSSAWKQQNWSRFDETSEPLHRNAMEYNRPQMPTPRPVENRPMQDAGYQGRTVPVTGEETGQNREHLNLDYGDLGDPKPHPGATGDRERGAWHEEVLGNPNPPQPGPPGVDVHAPPSPSDMGGGARLGWGRYEPIFQDHYQRIYGMRGTSFEEYRPAYQYGYEFAQQPRYRDLDWFAVEPELRSEWQRRGERSTWDDVKDAVRYAWDSIIR
jgi:hypothetical protein